jgi:hypothetical protein
MKFKRLHMHANRQNSSSEILRILQSCTARNIKHIVAYLLHVSTAEPQKQPFLSNTLTQQWNASTLLGLLSLDTMRSALFNGPNRIGVSQSLTCRQKQIQFPERCILWNTGSRTKSKNPLTQCKYFYIYIYTLCTCYCPEVT